jgi:hypothetical protein
MDRHAKLISLGLLGLTCACSRSGVPDLTGTWKTETESTHAVNVKRNTFELKRDGTFSGDFPIVLFNGAEFGGRASVPRTDIEYVKCSGNWEYINNGRWEHGEIRLDCRPGGDIQTRVVLSLSVTLSNRVIHWIGEPGLDFVEFKRSD